MMPQLNDVIIDHIMLLFVYFYGFNFFITLIELVDDDIIPSINLILLES
jgi:hypothetical protein